MSLKFAKVDWSFFLSFCQSLLKPDPNIRSQNQASVNVEEAQGSVEADQADQADQAPLCGSKWMIFWLEPITGPVEVRFSLGSLLADAEDVAQEHGRSFLLKTEKFEVWTWTKSE